jgi:hypothetical protein
MTTIILTAFWTKSAATNTPFSQRSQYHGKTRHMSFQLHYKILNAEPESTNLDPFLRDIITFIETTSADVNIRFKSLDQTNYALAQQQNPWYCRRIPEAIT